MFSRQFLQIYRDLQTDTRAFRDHNELTTGSGTTAKSGLSFVSPEKSVLARLEEKMKVAAAYHEAGHIVCAWFLPHIKEACKVICKNLKILT